jgi:hypothetical protein
MSNETIATYQDGGHTYEIDHLGCAVVAQWGTFAVYRDSEQVTEFAIKESALKPEHRPDELPVSTDELIQLAKQAVAADDDDVDDEEPEDNAVRAKWTIDGAKTLAEAAQKAREFADFLQGLHDEGYVLRSEIDGDYGFYYKP